MAATGKSMRKKGWGQDCEGCWGEAGSVQRQDRQVRSLKSSKAFILQQANSRNINMNEKTGFLTEPVSAGVKEALRVMSKRQKQITEGSWQGCN